MFEHTRYVTLVMALVFCLSAVTFGQETSGSIEGTVKDPNGAVIPGMSVTIQSTGGTVGFNKTVTTDENGSFYVTSVPVGSHRVTVASSKGFKGFTSDVTVVLGRSNQLRIALEAGVGEVNVTVTADDTPQIDTSESKLATNITSQVINALPKGTLFSSLLKTAPNVRAEPLAAGFQIDGASGAENVYVIDGQEVTNAITGQLNTNNNIPFELVQEVQIKSTGYEAEYGGATGGVINVATAGGNNQFRGNFGLSFQTPGMQGKARPVLNRFSNAANGFEYYKSDKIGGTAYFPTGRLSGPVIKDKMWLSAVYAPQIFDVHADVPYYVDPNTVDALGRNVPSADPSIRRLGDTRSFDYRFKVEDFLARLDAQPSSKLRVFGTFLWNPIVETGASLGYASTAPTTSLTSGLVNFSTVNPFGPLIPANDLLNNQGGRQNSNTINGQATYTPSSNLVLNIRAGRTFLNQKLGSYGLPQATRFQCNASGNPAAVAGSGCSRGFSNFPSNYQTPFDVTKRTTLDADASVLGVNLGGRHNFKLGYQYNGISNETRQGYRNEGIVVLYYALGIDNLTGQTPTPGNLGSGLLQRFETVGNASSSNQGFYGQDSWQIGGRLTLNLGLRAEIEDVPSFNAANPGIKFGLGDKLSPRLGFAWDPFGKGRTKIFGSYGLFYDRFKYQLPRGSFGGDFFRRDFFEILPSRGAAYTNYTVASILGTTPDVPGGNCPSATPAPIGNGWSVCQFDYRIPSNLVGGSVDESGAVDPKIKAGRQSEYTFGFEQQLGKTFLLSTRFTHKKVDVAIEDVGIPNAQGSEAYVIGNPGFGLACEVAKINGFGCTKAERDYKALEFRFDKRMSNNWFFNASYTFSRLSGNYSGLASSDEFGRSSPNVNRFFDLPFLGFNADGVPDNGPLPTDRPHVFKAFGGYMFDWNKSKAHATDISFYTSLNSGTPITTVYSLFSVTSAILNKRGDLGRTEMFTETDLSIKHTYKFGRDGRMSFQPYLNIRNLFDEQNELTRQTTYAVSNFSASSLRAGGCPATVCVDELTSILRVFNGGIRQYVLDNVAANPSARLRNDYNKTNLFQAPREVRFGVRLFF